VTKREMIFNYPFLNFKTRNYPYRYYNYPFYRNNHNAYAKSFIHDNLRKNIGTASCSTIEANKHAPSSKIDITENKTSNQNESFFSILGIKLYFDDIIILALLFFLYNEGVKDDGLFTYLILLLLS